MTSPGTHDRGELRCPTCGAGVIVDLSFDEGTGAERTPRQEPSARQVVTFSCGHETLGPPLASADQERLEVERRASEDTVEPAADPELGTEPG
jgi:hypothetical protein